MSQLTTTEQPPQANYQLRKVSEWNERGVTFQPDVTLEDLARNYIVFDTLESSSQWAKVDLLRKAVEIDPENGLATIEMLTGASQSRLRAMLRTGHIFPTWQSRRNLHYSHHEILATAELTPDQRSRLLDIAEQEQLSTRGLIEQKKRIMQLGPGSHSDTMVWRVTDLTARAKTLLSHYLRLAAQTDEEPMTEFVNELQAIISYLDKKYEPNYR